VNHHNRTRTRKLADVVWQPSVETILQKNVAGLATTTDRTGLCPDETLELEIGERLSVDDGRDISL
jgi:hypothetical protein